jgi:hypothetical protein
MATSTFSITAGNITSDATFRTLGSSISNAIAAVNIVKTSDTGQVNWTTVTKPASANVVAGYEIWKFNDALQATYPVYIKIEYGTGGNDASFYGLWITVGTGTDGAGNLTGNKSNRHYLYGNGNESATRASYFSGDTNRLAFCLWPNLMSGQWCVFGIERTHDSAGADTNAGVHILLSSAVSNLGCSQYLPLGATSPYLPGEVTGGWYCSAPLSGGGSFGGNVYTYPIKTYNMVESLPIFNFIHYAGSDLTTGTTVAVTGYDSASRNYLAPGLVNSTLGWFAFSGCSLSTSVAMRYE